MKGALTDRYAEAKRIALEAAELPEAERETFVVETCGGDEPLLREVRWMLAAIDSTHTAPLPVLPVASLDLTGHDAHADTPRQYRLIRHLGEGGMGMVYLAERCDGDFTQQVALKLLTAAAEGSPILNERFGQERRLLARLEHPGIARLLDGGALADGKPFLAMEFVDGERIDMWCDRQGLDLTQRIALFLKVCAAVEYAHRNLIIHRDIKPANILVTADGTPKLLDFGIARMLGDELDPQRTATAAQAMTLAYASPEQIERLPLTTAADVYSLGVVLYQLVAGRRPYQHLVTPHLLSNAIVSGDVVPPSRAARQARQEAGLPPSHARAVPRDLDAIVLKALRRKVDDRYASVTELAADLQRFLEYRPVQARRGRHWYRARRFVQRNRWPLAAASAVVLAVLAGLAGSLVALHNARAARQLAEQRQQQLERVVKFQQAMLENVDIDAMGHAMLRGQRARLEAALARNLPASERKNAQALTDAALGGSGATDLARGALETYVVDHALDGLSRSFGDAPLLAADLRQSLARVLIGIGSYAHAADELRSVLASRRQLLPANDIGLLSARVDLGRALEAQGETSGAAQVYGEALEAARTLPWSNPLRVDAEAGNARVLVARGKLDDALALQQEALAGVEKAQMADTLAVLRLRRDAVDTLVQLGRYDEARKQMERLAPEDAKVLGAEDAETLSATMTLAKLLRQQGNYERSLALARQVLDVRQRKLGEDHPATVDAAYLTAIDETKLTDTVAGLAKVQGEIERVVRMRRELFGADNPQTVSAMTGLVAVLIKAGDKADDDRMAVAKYGEAIAIEHAIVDSHERMLGPDHPNTLLAHGSLASILQRAGRYREAEAEARYTLTAQERVLGRDHPIVSGTLNLIGDICRDAGNLPCARDAYRTALTRRATLMGPLAAPTIESASSLYEVLTRMHQSLQAADIRTRYLRQVIEMDPATLDASMRWVRAEAIRVTGR